MSWSKVAQLFGLHKLALIPDQHLLEDRVLFFLIRYPNRLSYHGDLLEAVEARRLGRNPSKTLRNIFYGLEDSFGALQEETRLSNSLDEEFRATVFFTIYDTSGNSFSKPFCQISLDHKTERRLEDKSRYYGLYSILDAMLAHQKK
ncbi:uncharacterized protein BT62DRAFT_923468 [Guyanagaster necrorhizus]|uniref:Uncharacterized protein n=1 Tax=Guyanagaster necrorhizus TaxID=856835 RepID=A0A9P7VIK7_9AGAR|nr:uncharacterized protein BT62DRAFT_923468 [Guyanagaster necrorhizus MCA 3950]KAG7441248.1 hypothetical protein BT62DRAFT_923468 [Guyanagaster necrorhizus MCA 3950]